MTDIFDTHPRWKELERLVNEIDNLTEKAKKLRKEIDTDLFEKLKATEFEAKKK